MLDKPKPNIQHTRHCHVRIQFDISEKLDTSDINVYVAGNKAILYILGLDSQFAIVETILTGILDWKPNWRKFKTIIIAIVCAFGFIFGLPMATGVSWCQFHKRFYVRIVRTNVVSADFSGYVLALVKNL